MIGTLKDRLRIAILDKCGWDYSLALKYTCKKGNEIIHIAMSRSDESISLKWWAICKVYSSLEYEFLYQIDMRKGVYE